MARKKYVRPVVWTSPDPTWDVTRGGIGTRFQVNHHGVYGWRLAGDFPTLEAAQAHIGRVLAREAECYGCGSPGGTKDPVYGYWCARCSGARVPVLV